MSRAAKPARRRLAGKFKGQATGAANQLQAQTLDVAAGVLTRDDGRILLTERPTGRQFAGYLEFPGGKLEAGEAPRHGLRREFAEELGLAVLDAAPLIRFRHVYPEFSVCLHVFRVSAWWGEPQGREGQRLRWAHASELKRLKLLPADRPIVTALELPAVLLVTPEPDPARLGAFVEALERAFEHRATGGAIVRIRDPATAQAVTPNLSELAGRIGRPILLHAAGVTVPPPVFAGLHFPATRLRVLDARPAVHGWVGASVHGVEEAARARELALDYVIVGSVRNTPTHPHRAPLGWEGFARIAAAAGLPAYAIGGMGPADLSVARNLWGQGIAATRALWPEA